ncbi:MAG: hypothetical protein ACR2F2_10090 [Pyrinomonadaceae bacterium]
MKKHIIGFTIFTFIVGSFAIIWALFGYFTQTIPTVPKVESDNVPVFKSENRRSCRMKDEKISYEVVDSYYFADENVVVSTLKLKWNGYGTPPESITILPKIYTADNETVISGQGTFLRDIFESKKEVNVTVKTFPYGLSKKLLNENIYTDFYVTSETGASVKSDFEATTRQVIVVHGESSIIAR